MGTTARLEPRCGAVRDFRGSFREENRPTSGNPVRCEALACGPGQERRWCGGRQRPDPSPAEAGVWSPWATVNPDPMGQERYPDRNILGPWRRAGNRRTDDM